MRIICLSLFTLFFFGCRSFLLNSALASSGVYDDKILLETLISNNKTAIFFPMHHVGTEAFYSNVKEKVDSLEVLGYYFLYERVNDVEKDDPDKDLIEKKMRKITELPNFTKNYEELLDSIAEKKNIRFRKKLMMQPSYTKLGLDTIHLASRSDLSYKEIVDHYESKYGEIKLEKCDYETPNHLFSSCKTKPKKKNYNELLLEIRNNKVIEDILNAKQSKIAIIYGKAHLPGIKDSLLQVGFDLK